MVLPSWPERTCAPASSSRCLSLPSTAIRPFRARPFRKPNGSFLYSKRNLAKPGRGIKRSRPGEAARHVGRERRPAAHLVERRRIALDDAAGERRTGRDLRDELVRCLARGVHDGPGKGFERDRMAPEDLGKGGGVALMRVGKAQGVLGPCRLEH